jgi:hypothetical protein
MREICTSGSAGAPGEQSPGATRPFKLEVAWIKGILKQDR